VLHKPHGEVWPFDVDRFLTKFTTKMDSERNMLSCFLAKLAQYDPDIYIGHDLNFDLLLIQLWNHKVPYWSKIGRLKRSSQPQKVYIF
jgi:DNA polymerase alpha subunit A